MKKFLIKTTTALAITGLIHVITVYLFANGKIDNFYLRFTTERQHSLILGNSRAAQGIVPQFLAKNLAGHNGDASLFNYSFTISTSPYGPYYLESIKKKLDTTSTDGIFIVCVDPWSISITSHIKNDDPAFYEESELIPYNMRFVNLSPNWEYLYKNFHKGWGDMIIANTFRRTQLELHENGWLEVTIPMEGKRHQKRVEDKIRLYRQTHFYAKKFSATRLSYLKKTIDYLKSYGKVYMVRIPLHKKMAETEKEYLPEFDDLMEAASRALSVPYLNYIENTSYRTTDGNHLYKADAILFTEQLSKDIMKLGSRQKNDTAIGVSYDN